MRGTGRPDEYRTADGTRVPSVTTITGRFKDSGGLLRWANNEGLAGRKLYEDTSALEIGSIVHDLVETFVHGGERAVAKHPILRDLEGDLLEPVKSGYGAFVEWWRGGRFSVVATEVPFVSEKHKFGGTIDCIVVDGQGRLALADWKTSNALSSDYICQIAAYGQLWNEVSPKDKKLTGGFHLVRFAKQHGDFTHKWFPELNAGWRMFLNLRAAYEEDKELKKRIK